MRSPTWIIADDLTGAADSGVAFVKTTGPVRLLLGPGSINGQARRPVVAVDTATREMTAPDARARTRELAEGLGRDDVVFKKIDSTLRGHVAAEVAALRERLPDRLVVVAPAFPAAGRVTVGAVQHVDGKPLHLSGAWSFERRSPPRSVPDLFAPSATSSVSLADVRSSTSRLTSLLNIVGAQGRLAVCDAATEEDLRAIVNAANAAERPILWVGSAGLAAALAEASEPADPGLLRTDRAEAPATPLGSASVIRFLAVIGSATPVAQQQALALAAEGANTLELPAQTLAGTDQVALQKLAAEVSTAVATGATVVTIRGAAEPRNAAAVTHGLAAATAPAATATDLLLLTGGATARAVLLRAGLVSLDILGELSPGVVLLTPAGEPPQLIVTKAGAFGDEQTLTRAVHSASRWKGAT
jgi:D-threonate/D-erythronate kinase